MREPTDSGIVVVRPRVDNAVLRCDEADTPRRVRHEHEENNLHTRESAFIAQPLHVCRNDPEILGNDVECAELPLDFIEERLARPLDPMPVDRRLRLSINRPIGLEGAEMVDADDVHLLVQFLKAPLPPRILLGLHGLPVILRIAPELPIRSEVVRRHPRYRARRTILIEIEKLLMRPRIRAVLCHKDGHIAEDLNPLLPRVVMQAIPLQMKDVLLKPVELDLIPLTLRKRRERCWVAILDLVGPLHPRCTMILLLRRMKERIVIEPVCLLFTEVLVHLVLCALPAEYVKCLFEQILFELFDTRKIDEGSIRLIRQEEIFLRQPATGGKLLRIDHHDIAGKGRDGLIGRVAGTDRTERQNLPDLLPRLGEKVEEAVRLLSKIPHAVFRRQRSRMQENACLALITARFLALTKE